MKNKIERFDTPKVSSKIGICGLPIRADTYSGCSFGCTYCFSNNRKIMGHSCFNTANLDSLETKLDRIFNKHEIKENDLLENLIADGITWHLGGMSDPFSKFEEEYHITKQFIDITDKYGISLLISTKSDTVYGADIRPELHSFQLSISNVENNKELEPNVPDIESRHRFYRELKDKGFKVGIRIQPFIPNKTSLDIIEMFKDADNVTLEGLKMVPQNKEHIAKTLSATGLSMEDFKFSSLWNLKPEMKLEMYKPFISCLCKHLFASNRQEGVKTVEDFINRNFHNIKNPLSKEYQHITNDEFYREYL